MIKRLIVNLSAYILLKKNFGLVFLLICNFPHSFISYPGKRSNEQFVKHLLIYRSSVRMLIAQEKNWSQIKKAGNYFCDEPEI